MGRSSGALKHKRRRRERDGHLQLPGLLSRALNTQTQVLHVAKRHVVFAVEPLHALGRPPALGFDESHNRLFLGWGDTVPPARQQRVLVFGSLIFEVLAALEKRGDSLAPLFEGNAVERMQVHPDRGLYPHLGRRLADGVESHEDKRPSVKHAQVQGACAA